MIRLQGRGVSRGAAQGPLYFLHRAQLQAEPVSRLGPEEERARLKSALVKAAGQLREIAQRCRNQSGEEAALLFETHALLLEDEDFTSSMDARISSGATAERAVKDAGDSFAAMFSAMDDAYMQARAADVLDVSRRVADCLSGNGPAPAFLPGPVILAADDLSPSETVQLDRTKILGFATRFGSAASHTAILARTMGIPAVCALGDGLRSEYAGRTACLDGESGQLIVDPDAAALKEFSGRMHSRQALRAELEALAREEDVTADGRRMDVCCNIGSLGDIPAVLQNGARGVGLFRSEFLYLAAGRLPSEEEQFTAYRDAAAAMNGRQLVIRTLDVGADKQADYLGLEPEENPALGMRGVRVCLSRPELFRSQLRAIYRASAFGNVAILFPMIASAWEIRQCRRICEEVMDDLEREGAAFRRATPLGAMIETPAASLIADELAKEADFFSVGTNDLTQYILACDRQSGALDRFIDPKHPAVLRAVKLAADAARAAGIWIGVCGELASDPDMVGTFLALGVDELSVAPADVLPLRQKIRSTRAGDCTLDRLGFRNLMNEKEPPHEQP